MKNREGRMQEVGGQPGRAGGKLLTQKRAISPRWLLRTGRELEGGYWARFGLGLGV